MGGVVYHLWSQRNARIHGENILSEEQLLKKWEIGVRMAARGNFKESEHE